MNHLFEDTISGMRALGLLQRQYDDDMWEIGKPDFANLRHIHLHLSRTLGKIATLVEPRDHLSYKGEEPDVTELAEELSPILADLVMHAAQISNMVGGNLGQMVKDRYVKNAPRFAPESVFTRL